MSRQIGLFEAVGVELEYMIVDLETSDVKPIADKLLEAEAGSPQTDVERGAAAWSNELVLHVLEMKTNGPAPALAGLGGLFQSEIRHANEKAAALGARLMPGGMHPWMDPSRETHLWPHEYNEVYQTFDRIFGCAGHGWANLQSTHLNLPFSGDDEFRALHAAVRAVLPLVPALAAASPVHDGRSVGVLDGRVAAYKKNARRVPSVAGMVIPEVAHTRDEYESQILGRIYRDMQPHDPEGILRHEWVNARGAIARFDRGTIEIRLVDAQESPKADLAVTAAIHGAVKRLTLDAPEGLESLEALETERLAGLLDRTIRSGDEAEIDDPLYLRAVGSKRVTATAGQLWQDLMDGAVAPEAGSQEWAPHLEVILRDGCLARRLLRALGGREGRADLVRVWTELSETMESNEPFGSGASHRASGHAT